jgi:hypothetical protein
MGKIKYNVKGVEPGQDFDTPIPVGMYVCKISDCKEGVSKTSGNQMVTVELEVIRGEDGKKWAGRKLWDYITFADSQAWKLSSFIHALSLKESGALDPRTLIGKKLNVKVKHETDDEYGTRAKVRSLLPMNGETEEEDEDEDEPDVEPDEPEAEEDEDEDEDDEDLTMEDLEGYDRDELEELIEANELDVSYNKRTSDETLKERIAEELGLTSEEEEEDDDDEEDEDYNEWSVPDLKKELKSRGLSAAGTKKTLVKKLEKDDQGDSRRPF